MKLSKILTIIFILFAIFNISASTASAWGIRNQFDYLIGFAQSAQAETCFAQTFEVGKDYDSRVIAPGNYTPKYIKLNCGYHDTPHGLLYLAITATHPDGTPDPTIFYAQANISFGEFSGSAQAWRTFKFNWSSELKYGTKYAITFNSTNCTLPGDYYTWYVNTNALRDYDPYGTFWYDNDYGLFATPFNRSYDAGYQLYTWLPGITEPNITSQMIKWIPVTATNATLTAHLSDDFNITVAGEGAPFDAWIMYKDDNLPITKANCLGNLSVALPVTNYSYSHFTVNTPSTLTPGNYYYYKAGIERNNEWNWSANEGTFLTKPLAPTNLRVLSTDGHNITLDWTKAVVNVTDLTTVISYKAGSFPASPNDGTIAYNGTGNTCTIGGLDPGSTYHISAFSYINASGSPFYWWFSDTADTETGTTTGGTWNFTVHWECNLSGMDNNSLFQNSRVWAESYDGRVLATNYSLTTNNFSLFTLDTTPDVFFFKYNNNSNYTRALLRKDGQYNYTFYVCCEPMYEGTGDLNDYQRFYTFTFIDETPNLQFTTNNQSALHIYVYNGSTRVYLHEDYWGADESITVALEYNERYWFGASIPTADIPFLGYVDLLDNYDIEIQIRTEDADEEFIWDYVRINASWANDQTGLFVNYTDWAAKTTNFTVRIYRFYSTNTTRNLVNTTAISNTDIYSVHYRVVDGCLLNTSHYIEVEIEHGNFNENKTIIARLFPINFSSAFIHSPSWLNAIIEDSIGICPFTPVAWSDLIAFVICFVILTTFSMINGEVGLIISGIAFAGMEFVFGFASLISAQCVIIGALMATIGFISIYGGKR